MSDAPFSGGKNKSSQFDPGGVIKNVHDLHGQNLRVRDALSIAPDHWSHFSVVYDGQDRPTSVSYYRGTAPTKTTIQALPDVAGSLQNKYFLIYSGFDNQKHHVWFNVDGTGVNPAPSNSIGIEIAINSNDTAVINAKAIQLTINMLFGVKFTASVANSTVYINNVNYGLFTDSADFNTGFTISTQDGTNEEVSAITISYDIDGNPIWQGQTLKNYYYDVYSGKFVRSAAIDIENVTVDVDLDGFSLATPDSVQVTGSEDGTKTGIKHSLKIDSQNDAAVFDSRVKQELEDSKVVLEEIRDAVQSPPVLQVDLDGFSPTDPDSVQITGSLDGTSTGQKYGVVYNRRQQVLDSHDRVANFTYADFGTKDQRITAIEYTSATFSGVTIRREFTYTLVSGRYRRDSETWEEL
jgi:hypothetical protein